MSGDGTGLGETIAACAIAAFLIGHNTLHSIAANLIGGVEAVAGTSLCLIWPCSSRVIRVDVALIQPGFYNGGVHLTTASELCYLCSLTGESAVGVVVAWARHLGALNPVDWATLLGSRVVPHTSITAEMVAGIEALARLVWNYADCLCGQAGICLGACKLSELGRQATGLTSRAPLIGSVTPTRCGKELSPATNNRSCG